MGKGKFVYTLAKENPNTNFIGIERFDSVIVRALEKVIEAPLKNLMLLRTDASDLRDIFSSNSIERVYLNFSDPWPKERHAKRRLTHKNFLDIYKDILKDNCELHFKTDNKDLFHRFELSAIAGVGYKLNKGEGMNIGIKYMFGLTNVLRDEVRTSKNSSFYFYVGIPIGKGKAEAKREESEE